MLRFSQSQLLEIPHPEAAVRAIACAGILGLVPTISQFKWAFTQAKPYEDCNFWLPYGKHRGALFMKPEYIGLLNYIGGRALTEADLARIEPEAFYKRIVAQVEEIDPSGSLKEAAAQAYWLGHPTGALNACDTEWADALDILYTEVRVAAADGLLMVDPRKIKRMLRVAA